MWSVPLRVSCPGPVLRLACLGGGGPVLVPPYLAWGCGGGGWASPGGCLRPLRGAWGVPLPSSARPLGGLSGSALRACGCGGPALSLRGGREVSSWCPGAGPPDSHDEPDEPNVPVHGPAEQPYRGLTLSTGGGGCGRVCSVTRVPAYLRRQPPRR